MAERRKIVILNQAANYLTIGYANAFSNYGYEVVLISGSVHVQGEQLRENIYWHKINKWYEAPTGRKMLSYFFALVNIWWLLITKYKSYEVFFISVPPMGYLLNLILPHKFSMIIWDVYPDVFKITGMKESHPVYKIWSYFNKKSFKKAYRLFTISNKMVDLLEKYIVRDKIIVQPIWSIFNIDHKIEKENNQFINNYELHNKFIVQYSGNIGLTHNVEVLIEIAELLKDNNKILFQIIGRGPRKEHLQNLVEMKKLHNCMFLPFQPDNNFPYSLSAADLGVVVLDEKISKGSVPSKSFNIMSLGIPSLYIAAEDSELAEYANKYKHAKLFTKQNLSLIAKWIEDFSENKEKQDEMSVNAVYASKFYKRDNADRFVEKYLET